MKEVSVSRPRIVWEDVGDFAAADRERDTHNRKAGGASRRVKKEARR